MLAGCGAAPAPVETRFDAFGTAVRLELVAPPDEARAASRELQQFFAVAGRDWYAFGDGELARVNARLARGEPAPVSDTLAPLLRKAMDLSARSGGRFDPAVCALVRLWQFDTEADLATAAGPPAGAEVRALRARQGTMADVRLDGNTVSASRPLCIDLGGLAKGSALEAARQRLMARGIRDALLDLGGSSQLALGRNGNRPWTIGLLHPRENRVVARLALAPGEAASTSGDYERGYVQDGRRFHHILDPRTGQPTAGTATVLVIATDAELADAASTALMVAGPDAFAGVCRQLGLAHALLVTTGGRLLATPAMAARLRRDNGGRLPDL